jgi:hypothetical protein
VDISSIISRHFAMIWLKMSIARWLVQCRFVIRDMIGYSEMPKGMHQSNTSFRTIFVIPQFKMETDSHFFDYLLLSDKTDNWNPCCQWTSSLNIK